MNDRHPSGDPHLPAPDAGHVSYASYDQQGVQYGDGYASYDGYDAYATGSVATATTAFSSDTAYPTDHTAATGYPADAFATGSFAPGAFAGAGDYDADPLFGDLPGASPASDYATGTYATGQWDGAGAFDPLSADPYGAQPHTEYDTGGYAPGGSPGADQDLSGQWDAAAWTGGGGAAAGAWDTDPYAQHAAQPYETAGYDATGYDTSADHTGTGHHSADHQTTDYDASGAGTHGFGPNDHDPGALEQPGFAPSGFGHTAAEERAFDTSAYETFPYESPASGSLPYETSSYETSSYESAPHGGPETELAGYEHEPADVDASGFGTESDHTDASDPYADPAAADHTHPAVGTVEDAYDGARQDDDAYGNYAYGSADGHGDANGDGAHDEGAGDAEDEQKVPAPRRAAGRGGPGRGNGTRRSTGQGSGTRRRSPAKRSALLTVAVPSVCVMGVAGVAAASVLSSGDDKPSTQASDIKPSEANNKLDAQLDNLSAGTRDFADRASRTQERIDLKAAQEAERRKQAEEAARKERLRPKFALPVSQHGLSAYFGQAGVNWMSVHTGIDFPVAYGTQVMAATDGTVRFQYNTAYGNMAIVTAKDGTETWYCHLSSYRISSGSTVKAGDVIAFSGNSGNSTGPHLHFEVRPGGGAAIDPLPWLRSHGLDPN